VVAPPVLVAVDVKQSVPVAVALCARWSAKPLVNVSW
jgi:hypothetical protein